MDITNSYSFNDIVYPADYYKLVYCHVDQSESWRIPLLFDILNCTFYDNFTDEFNNNEILTFLEYVCTS